MRAWDRCFVIEGFIEGKRNARNGSRPSRRLYPRNGRRGTSFSAAGYRPVAPDLPGYGERPAVDHMDFEGLAADIEAEIARLGLASPVLVGHSMGGMVAQTALRRRPNAYRAAVLACTSPAFGNRTGEFQKKFVADRLAPLDAGKTMADLARTVVAAMGPNPDIAARALASAAIGATPERTYRAAVHCLVGFDERANLAAIGIPILCLAGEHDLLAPPSGIERMAGKIPYARYACLSSVGLQRFGRVSSDQGGMKTSRPYPFFGAGPEGT